MARRKLKCIVLFLLHLAFVKCLPIISEVRSVKVDDLLLDNNTDTRIEFKNSDNVINSVDENDFAENINTTDLTTGNKSGINLRSVRPGQRVVSYYVDITMDGDNFEGTLIVRMVIDDHDTRGDSIKLHCEDLNIHSIQYGQFTIINPQVIDDFNVDNGVLEINPPLPSSTFIFLIQYSGTIRNDGFGIYKGFYEDDSYLAMNLHPTYARRVFPCMDEPFVPNTGPLITINFNNPEYNNIIANSVNEGNTNEAEFIVLEGPPHRWGLVAHNFITFQIPGENVQLYGRPQMNGQQSYALIMTQNLYRGLNEWTDRHYTEIHMNQNGIMNVFALPDITRDWYALSTVGIWEPYILLESTSSRKQQKTALIAMAEAYARQWFGYVIYPANWRYAWVTTGLEKYAAYDVAAEADTEIDVNTIFVADIIQESLLRDAQRSATVLQPSDDLFDEDEIRNHMTGLMQYKAPAIIRMLKLVLGSDNDYIQLAGRGLLDDSTLQGVNHLNFYDALNSEWHLKDDKLIDDISDFMEPWLNNVGYPVITVSHLGSMIIVLQEPFGFSHRDPVLYDMIPLTYTISTNPDFENVYPHIVMGHTTQIPVVLGEDDWILFNIQGQGYYRVDYDPNLWENIINALEDPDSRAEIHPLNRATILDDVLNLARSGRKNYDLAFEVVLTMELETEYAPWKAFIRNMNFIKKRLLPFVLEDEDNDFDPDIYLRMIRRTIPTFEDEIGFEPEITQIEDPMVSLTRGMVMDHVCRSNYQPCIAAAFDWFFDSNGDEPTVNPQIPNDLRPAVYCTVVHEGDDSIIDALWNRFEIEISHYERVVILESLACSTDSNLILRLLQETLDPNGRFGMEERGRFFEAVVESSYQNTGIALAFLRMNTNAVRDMYGGPEKLEKLILVLAENIVTEEQVDNFEIWINNMNNNLDDSQGVAERALELVRENIEWDHNLEFIYEWIDENDAPTLAVSAFLLIAAVFVNMLNR